MALSGHFYLDEYTTTIEQVDLCVFCFSSVQGFEQPVRFCRFDEDNEHRDVIQNDCVDGWSNNFVRYGGNPQTDKTIPVDHKANDAGAGVRSILSLHETGGSIIYIPGKSTKNILFTFW